MTVPIPHASVKKNGGKMRRDEIPPFEASACSSGKSARFQSTENPLIRRRAIRKVSMDVDLATLFNISNPRLAYSSRGFARSRALETSAAMAGHRRFFCVGVERLDAVSSFTSRLPDKRENGSASTGRRAGVRARRSVTEGFRPGPR